MIATGQEDQRLHFNVQKYACYLFCILAVVEQRTRIKFDDPGYINTLYQLFVSRGWIREDCLIQDAPAIFGNFGLRVEQRTFTPGIDGLKFGADPGYRARPDEVEILCFHWAGKDFTHFVLGDGRGSVAYDPIARGSNTVKNGILKSKRIFKIYAAPAAELIAA